MRHSGEQSDSHEDGTAEYSVHARKSGKLFGYARVSTTDQRSSLPLRPTCVASASSRALPWLGARVSTKVASRASIGSASRSCRARVSGLPPFPASWAWPAAQSTGCSKGWAARRVDSRSGEERRDVERCRPGQLYGQRRTRCGARSGALGWLVERVSFHSAETGSFASRCEVIATS